MHNILKLGANNIK